MIVNEITVVHKIINRYININNSLNEKRNKYHDMIKKINIYGSSLISEMTNNLYSAINKVHSDNVDSEFNLKFVMHSDDNTNIKNSIHKALQPQKKYLKSNYNTIGLKIIGFNEQIIKNMQDELKIYNSNPIKQYFFFKKCRNKSLSDFPELKNYLNLN